MRTNVLLFLCCVFFSLSHAQDVITQKNGEKIEVKIVELSDDFVKYYYFDDPDQVLITMNRSLIRDIKFEYGRKEEEIQPGLDESYYVDDHINNVYVNFLAAAAYTTIVGYERAIDPTSSLGGAIKLHGIGANASDYWDEKSGFGVEVNYKVKTGSVFKKDQYRPNHILQGLYLRPDAGFTSVKQSYQNYNGTTDSEKYSYFYGGFDFGNEFIFNNRLALDLFTGINFYGGSYEENRSGELRTDYPTITDGNMSGDNNVAIRYGIQLGFLF